MEYKRVRVNDPYMVFSFPLFFYTHLYYLVLFCSLFLLTGTLNVSSAVSSPWHRGDVELFVLHSVCMKSAT